MLTRPISGHNAKVAQMRTKMLILLTSSTISVQEKALGSLDDQNQYEVGHHRREIQHANARHELADGSEDRFRDLLNEDGERVRGVKVDQGEDDSDRYSNQ